MLDKFYMTEQGRELCARSQTGAQLLFTKMVMGDGNLAQHQTQQGMTQLIRAVMEVPVVSVESLNGIASVRGQISNAGLDHAVTFRELGLFARGADGVELLYAYGNAGANADVIPLRNEARVDYQLALECVIDNAEDVAFSEQPSLVFATVEDLNAYARKPNTFNAVLKAGGWTSRDGGFGQAISVPGLRASGMVYFVALEPGLGTVTEWCGASVIALDVARDGEIEFVARRRPQRDIAVGITGLQEG